MGGGGGGWGVDKFERPSQKWAETGRKSKRRTGDKRWRSTDFLGDHRQASVGDRTHLRAGRTTLRPRPHPHQGGRALLQLSRSWPREESPAPLTPRSADGHYGVIQLGTTEEICSFSSSSDILIAPQVTESPVTLLFISLPP